MKPTVIHNTNSGNDINNYSDPNANNNPDIQPQLLQQQQQQQHPQQHPQQQQQPQGIYDNNGLAGGANSRRFPFYPTGFDFFDDDELFPEGGVRSRLNRMRDPFGTWGRKRRNSQEHVAPQQTAQGGTVPQTQQIPQPDEGYEDDFFPQMQPAWGTDTTWGRAPRKRNPNLDDDDDFFSYIPQQFRQYIPSNFQFPRMRSSFGRQQVPTQAAHSPQSRNYFPQQQQQQSPPQHQKSVQQEPLNRPKYCDAAMQTDADLLSQSNANGQGDQPNLNQHGLRNTIDMGQKANDEFDEAGPRARSAPPDPNYQNDPNNPNNFASAQSFSSAAGFPGQKPQVYAQATATPGAQAQAHAQAHTANMGTNTGPGTPNGGNIYRQYYYPFDNNAAQPNSPPRQQQQQAPPPQQTSNNDGQFVRTVPIVIESRKVPAKPKPQPQNQPTPPQAQAPPQQQQPPLSTQPREIPIQVEHTKARNQAPPSPQAAQQPPPSPQAAEPEQPKTPAPHDSITKIQAIQKEVMELMLAVEQFKGNGRNKEYIYLDEMLTRNLIKLDDIETDGKENIRLARKEAIKCIQASLCVLEMKADGRIPAIDSKPDESQSTDDEPKIDATAQEMQSPEDSANATNDQEKTENATDKNDDDKTESKTDDTQAPSTPSPQANETNAVDSKENESENKNETSSKEVEPKSPVADETTPATVETAAPAADVKSAAEST